jgi:hypothetical protein
MWWSVFKRVFSKGRYQALGAVIFVIALSVVVLLPNLSLITQILATETVGVVAKLQFVLSFYGSLATNFTWFSASYTLVLLLLFAVNICLFVFYIRRAQRVTKKTKRMHISGVAGAISGALGIGCAACGSVILTAVATSLGATGLLLALPLHGGEFGLLGIVLLGASIRYLVHKINHPLVCRSAPLLATTEDRT